MGKLSHRFSVLKTEFPLEKFSFFSLNAKTNVSEREKVVEVSRLFELQLKL